MPMKGIKENMNPETITKATPINDIEKYCFLSIKIPLNKPRKKAASSKSKITATGPVEAVARIK
jgi:hypothetical protein